MKSKYENPVDSKPPENLAILVTVLTLGLSIPLLVNSYDETTVWLAVSVGMLLLSASLIYLSIRGAFVVAPVVLFLIYYICFLYVGALINFVDNPQENRNTLRVVTLGLFFFSIGVLFSSLYLRLNSALEYRKIQHQKLKDSWDVGHDNHAPYWLFLSGLTLAALYFFHAGGIPALADLVETARVEATAGGGYFLLGISIVLPFTSLVFIGKALARRKYKHILIAFFAVSVTSIVMVFAALKDLVPFFLLWIVFFFQFYSGRLSKKMMLVPLLSLVIAILMAGFTMKHKYGLEDEQLIHQLAVEVFSQRLFFAVVDVVKFIVESFPVKYDYLFGYSYWMNLVAALPGADIGFGGWINIEAFDMGGGATVPVVAELYANFGETGAYIGMLFTGIVVQSVYVYLLRNLATEKKLDSLIAITFLGMGFVTLAINSVFAYLLYTLAPIWACFVGLRVYARISRGIATIKLQEIEKVS